MTIEQYTVTDGKWTVCSHYGNSGLLLNQEFYFDGVIRGRITLVRDYGDKTLGVQPSVEYTTYYYPPRSKMRKLGSPCKRYETAFNKLDAEVSSDQAMEEVLDL